MKTNQEYIHNFQSESKFKRIHHKSADNKMIKSTERVSPGHKSNISNKSHKSSQSSEKQKLIFTNRRKNGFNIYQIRDKNKQSKDRYYSKNKSLDSHNQGKPKFQNVGIIHHLFNVMKNDQAIKNGHNNQKQHTGSMDQLKKQVRSLSYSKNQMIPSSIIRNKSKDTIKKRLMQSQQKLQKQEKVSSVKIETPKLVEITHKQMKDYAKYICMKDENYYTQIDYNQLRDAQKWAAFAKIDISQYKLIESINICLIDSLSKEDSSNQKLIKEYCSVYFQNQQRRKMEVFLNYHIFKAFAAKIKSFFTYQRIFYYATYKLADRGLLFYQNFATIISTALLLVELSIKSIIQTVKDLMSRNVTNIMETFRSLKIVKEIQKYNEKMEESFQEFSREIQQMPNYMDNFNEFKAEYSQILGNMRPFLGQSNFYHKVQEFQYRSQTILNWKFLKIPPIPYLPEKQSQSPCQKYTLVLGLNYILILFNSTTKILKYRAYMDTFLQKVSNLFQVVLWSDFQKDITDRIVQQIQKQQRFFKYRLYRTHMRFYGAKTVKDLRVLGRRLQQTIMLQCSKQSLDNCCHDNILEITPFKPSSFKTAHLQKQNALLTSLNQLLGIFQKNPEDVRPCLKQGSQLSRIPQLSSLEQRSLSISHNGNIYPK